MSFLWEYTVCDVVNAVSQSDVLPALTWLKNSFGLNPYPNDPTTNPWSKMIPCGVPPVSRLPFIYCYISSPIIWHTLNKLPFAPGSTLIMKPLLSFWLNCCLDMFIILFLTASTTTSGFRELVFKKSLSTIFFTTFLRITTQSSIPILYPVYNMYLFARNWDSPINVQPSVPHHCQKYILSVMN